MPPPSAPQSLSTVTVWDQEYQPGSATLTNPRPQVGVPIKIQLDYSQANTTSPQVNLEPVEITVQTDQNGYWQVNLVPNSAINPLNTTWQVVTPSSRYNISVPSSGPVQSSTIKVGVPVTLAPASSSVGPLTVNGAFTVNTGPVSLPAGSVGVAALSGILPIANGGTGSGTQTFVDLTTNQTVAGTKTFSGQIIGSAGAAITGAISASTTITATGETSGSDAKATGLIGAANQVRMVGRTTTGAPASGTFALGDFVVDGNGMIWICTAAGTPGTWVPTSSIKLHDASPSSGTSDSFSVPAGIVSVQLRIKIIATATTDCGIRLNGDVGNTYGWQETGSSGTSGSFTGQNLAAYSMMRFSAYGAAGDVVSATVNLNDLTGSTRKTMDSTAERAGTSGTIFATANSGVWSGTAAVTSIQVALTAGAFSAGTNIRAYGYA